VRRPVRVIVTLDPKKLAEKKQQCLHIGGVTSFSTYVLLLGRSTPDDTPLHYAYDSKLRGSIPYPLETNAFLYYAMSPGRPRIAGELRLRVTSSGDPASFESGSDLLRTDGRPWSRPLYVLPRFFPVYEKLREERFVPDDLDRALRILPSARLNYSRSQILYTLNDTFIVDFSMFESSVFVITEKGVESVSTKNMFWDQRRGKIICPPYTGAYTNHHLSILLH
jgi:hypothetical protein